MKQLLENIGLEKITHNFKRSPHQLNQFMEGDAELIRTPSGILAISIDSIVEEIESGLYDDPYLIGWMVVTANLSDIAAVGAQPLGIVLSQQMPPDLSPDFLSKIQRGIQDACDTYDCFTYSDECALFCTLAFSRFSSLSTWILDFFFDVLFII